MRGRRRERGSLSHLLGVQKMRRRVWYLQEGRGDKGEEKNIKITKRKNNKNEKKKIISRSDGEQKEPQMSRKYEWKRDPREKKGILRES